MTIIITTVVVKCYYRTINYDKAWITFINSTDQVRHNILHLNDLYEQKIEHSDNKLATFIKWWWITPYQAASRLTTNISSCKQTDNEYWIRSLCAVLIDTQSVYCMQTRRSAQLLPRGRNLGRTNISSWNQAGVGQYRVTNFFLKAFGMSHHRCWSYHAPQSIHQSCVHPIHKYYYYYYYYY